MRTNTYLGVRLALATSFVEPGAEISGVVVVAFAGLQGVVTQPAKATPSGTAETIKTIAADRTRPGLGTAAGALHNDRKRLIVRRGSWWELQELFERQAFGPTCPDDLPSALRFLGRALASASDPEAASRWRNHLRPDREG